MVKQGDLLFTIDKRPFQNTLDQARGTLAQAKANLAFAEADLERAKQLVRDNTITEQIFDQRTQASARRRPRSRPTRRRCARPSSIWNSPSCARRSPAASATAACRRGNLVTGGAAGNTTMLATIVSLDPIRFEFTFDEASYLRYERFSGSGKEVTGRDGGVIVALKLLDEKNFEHRGYMDFVDNVIDRSSGTIRGRAVFSNPDGVLTPGMFGRVRVPGSPTYQALLVPDAAIGSEQVRKFVLVVGGDNTAVQKYVTLGPLSDDNLRIIKDGLKADDRVIVNGLMRVRPGQKVTPQEQGATPAAGRPAGQGAVGAPTCGFRISSSTGRSSPRVVSIVIVILGAVAFLRLPIAQYPEIAPPVINVSGQYPGASAEVVASTVVAPIEEQINGVENMLYVSSNSNGDGRFSIGVTFDLGTNLDIAQVQVQNRVATALPRLPADVRNIGVTVAKASSDLMMVVHMLSPDKSRDALFISNYATLEIKDALTRVDGVGSIMVFGSRDYSMRIWLDPDRLQSLGMTANDVTAALQAQNIQVASGVLNQPPVDQARRLPDRGADARPARRSRAVRQYRHQADRRTRWCGSRTSAASSSPAWTIRRTPISTSIRRSRSRCSSGRARTRSPPRRTSARPWRMRPSGFRRGSNTTSSTTRPSSSSSRSTRSWRRSSRRSCWSFSWSSCSCRPGAPPSFRWSPFRCR